MARTKPSLAEALSPWSAPHDAADLLEGFRLSIVALAEEQHTGLPDSMRVLNALRLCKGSAARRRRVDAGRTPVRPVGAGADIGVPTQGRAVWPDGPIAGIDAIEVESVLGGWMNPRAKLTVSQAARYLHVSRRTMQRMRDQGTGPAYFRSGEAPNSPILYELADLDMWLAARKER